MAALDPHIIIEPYYDEAVYQLHTLPRLGVLTLNGVPMKVGDRWTQADVASGAFKYVQNKTFSTSVTEILDTFKFVVPLKEGGILRPNSPPRLKCLPRATIPSDGVFTFTIKILAIPRPRVVNNAEIEIMEDEHHCFTLRNFFMTSDPTVTIDPFSEIYPITYKVNSISPTSAPGYERAEFRLNGTKIKIGDTFTNHDINNGALCVYGLNHGKGTMFLGVTACVEGPLTPKCTSATIKVIIKEWQFADTENSSTTILECSGPRVLTGDEMRYTPPFGSTLSDITITFNPERTEKANSKPVRTIITPPTFTQQDVEDGLVTIQHACEDEVLNKFEKLVFDVCTNHGKCNQKIFNVTVIPIQVVRPPRDDRFVTTEDGCTYSIQSNGSMSFAGCGGWAIVVGRKVPDPAEYNEGDILYFPNGNPETTLILEKGENGQKEWVKLPFQMRNPPPQDRPSCDERTSAPSTKYNTTISTIKFTVKGKLNMNEFAWVKLAKENAYNKDENTPTIFPSECKVEFTPTRDWTPGENIFSRVFTYKVKKLNKGDKLVFFLGPDSKDVTISNVEINKSKVKIEEVRNGKDKGSSNSVDLNNKTIARLTIDKELGGVNEGPVGKCFVSKDGTKWVSNNIGEWAPVDKDPAVTDFTPVITGGRNSDSLIIDYDLGSFDGTSTTPTRKPKFICVRNKTTVLELQPDGSYGPFPNEHTGDFNQLPFMWLGPNEFWLPHGYEFDMPIFTTHMYVRVDIEDDAISPTAVVNKTGQSKFSNPFNMIGAGYSATTKTQVTYPVNVTVSKTPSGGNNPYHLGSYYIEFGENNIATFTAAIRPLGVPQLTSRDGYEVWREDISTIFSYGGWGSPLNQYRASVNVSSYPTQNVYNGAYGKYIPFVHNELWKHKAPGAKVQYLGWQVARLRMITDKNPMNANLKASPYSPMPPTKKYTLKLKLRATNLATGEVIRRTYKIHWNATGKSASGETQMMTDMGTISVPNSPPLLQGSTICKMDNNGNIYNCR